MDNRKGITLIELLIIVLILGALVAIAIPRISTSSTTSKTNACTTKVNGINSQIKLYHIDTGDWPVSLTDVTTNTSYFPDGEPTCSFSVTYDMNSTSYRVATHSDSDHGV